MKNIIVVHGSFGAADGNWFPWLADAVSGANPNIAVTVPQFPVGVGAQSYDSWSAVLAKLPINADTVLVGHSVGAVFVCRYLLERKIKVSKIITVAGFRHKFSLSPEYDAVNAAFFTDDDLAGVKRLCGETVCFYGDNDPYVPQDILRDFAENIGGETVVIVGGGHINAESGYTRFDEILRILRLPL